MTNDDAIAVLVPCETISRKLLDLEWLKCHCCSYLIGYPAEVLEAPFVGGCFVWYSHKSCVEPL